jgi:hypothetical protein
MIRWESIGNNCQEIKICVYCKKEIKGVLLPKVKVNV